jgi:polysaccharide biosynthesis/export protein
MNIYKQLIISSLFIAQFSSSQEIDSELISQLSQSQIEILSGGLGQNIISERPKPKVTESTVKAPKPKYIDKNLIGEKYGYRYFSSIPTSITAVGDLPLPNNYKISLKDQFTVILSGSREAIFDLDVKLDGTILFPEIGSISVVGETFEEVKKKLKNLIDQTYIGVQIDLSIKNLSAKKVTIVGAVNSPGTYLVNPFSTITSALAYSGGISEVGTLREIKLIRTNGNVHFFDLYKLLLYGDRSEDITIEAGDVIIINAAKQFVRLSGQIKRPAIYETLDHETLNDLIFFGLGFTNISNRTNISLNILDIKESNVKRISTSDLSSSLKGVLSVNINQYVSQAVSNIEVFGAVKEPGFYELSKFSTLEELINGLEFIDVYPWLGVLEQFDKDKLVKTSTFFSLNDPNTYKSINLLPNSRVYFANIDMRSFDVSPISLETLNRYKLTLNHRGDVYKLPVYGKFKIQSFVEFLGLDMNNTNDVATYVSPVDNIIKVLNYKDMEFVANQFHTITFKSPVNDLISVSVSGAVNYPGTYTLQSNSTIKDLYSILGGFKDEAFLDGVIFLRQSVRELQLKAIEKSKKDLTQSLLISSQRGAAVGNMNLITELSKVIEPDFLGRIAGNYDPRSLNSSDTILLDGDSIIVPKRPSTINVLGEVLNPSAFRYSKKINAREAIINAGGYKDFAAKNKVYVIKTNGTIKRAKRNIFTGDVKLEAGDTVIVPRKIITENPIYDSLLPVTQIISDLAFSAAALESLSNSQ